MSTKQNNKHDRKSESANIYAIDLRNRMFRFAVKTIRFLLTLPYKREYDVFRYQVSRSATAIGANYEEAQGAYSRKEFASKIGICFKETKETNYFLRIINELKLGDQIQRGFLKQESEEIMRIVGTIYRKVREPQK